MGRRCLRRGDGPDGGLNDDAHDHRPDHAQSRHAARRVCTAHAEAFSREHGLTIGEPPQRPPQPGLLEAAGGSGTTISVRLHCVRGRQWYLQQHRSGGTLDLATARQGHLGW